MLMLVKKMNLGNYYYNNQNPSKEKINSINKKRKKTNLQTFQDELFSKLDYGMEPEWKFEDKTQKTKKEIRSTKNSIENEIKKIFLGEIVRKDHLYSNHLTDMQKENLMRISFLY